MKKALMNASVASMIYKFNMNNIQILQDMEYQVDVACNFGKENPISQEQIENFREILKQKKIKVYETSCPRSVFAIGNMIKSYKQLKKIADEGQYDLVHTQSPIGGVICRLAFRKARKRGTKVIYTAHGFHFYKGAPIINWLIFYPIEKICSYFTDVLITINQEDYQLAKKKFHAKKVEYIPGVGISIEKFKQCAVSRNTIRKELGIPKEAFVLISVGEVNKNKNHQIIVRALGKIDNKNIHYIIVGQGNEIDNITKMANDLRVNVHTLGFREDVADLLFASDVFCFPSLREGLGLAAIEAMAVGLPIVTSNVHGINDYSENGKTGYSCDPRDVEAFAEAIQKLEKENLEKYRVHNHEIAKKKYEENNIQELMRKIYTIV